MKKDEDVEVAVAQLRLECVKQASGAINRIGDREFFARVPPDQRVSTEIDDIIREADRLSNFVLHGSTEDLPPRPDRLGAHQETAA